jgi:cbb3-type cytochrome oxidase subunit 1
MPIGRQESFSRWLLVGAPLLVSIGVIVGLSLHAAFDIPTLSSACAAVVLVFTQFGLYVPMYWIRRRFKREHDLRPAVAVFGAYSLVLGIVLIHYAARFHIGSTTESDYLGFSVCLAIAVGLALLIFSFQFRGTKRR